MSRAARTPCVLGTFDCCLWLADWVMECRGGPDPVARWRGHYSTELGCARLLKREGGMVALVHSAAATAMLAATNDPRPGDIGLVWGMTPRGLGDIGAIKTANGWAMLKHGGGLAMTPRVFVKASWAV